MGLKNMIAQGLGFILAHSFCANIQAVQLKEERQCLLCYVWVHLKWSEAPFFCDLCKAPLFDETHIAEHLTQTHYKSKQQKHLWRLAGIGRPLKINEVIEEQKPNVNAALMNAIETMSQQDKEKLPRQRIQSGHIVKQACKATFGDEVPSFEVEIRDIQILMKKMEKSVMRVKEL